MPTNAPDLTLCIDVYNAALRALIVARCDLLIAASQLGCSGKYAALAPETAGPLPLPWETRL